MKHESSLLSEVERRFGEIKAGFDGFEIFISASEKLGRQWQCHYLQPFRDRGLLGFIQQTQNVNIIQPFMYMILFVHKHR